MKEIEKEWQFQLAMKIVKEKERKERYYLQWRRDFIDHKNCTCDYCLPGKFRDR